MSSSWLRHAPWLVCAAVLVACSANPTTTDVPVVGDTRTDAVVGDQGTDVVGTDTTGTDVVGTDVVGTDTQGTDVVETDTQGTDAGNDVVVDTGNPCLVGQLQCAGTCIDPQTSSTNCGACGTICGTGQSCAAGACVCPSGLTACGTGSAATCQDTQSDRLNCGTCGTACTTGQVCVAGACVVDCVAPNTRCGTGTSATCEDTQTSASNCGSCGNACPAGQVCTTGRCGCAGGQLSCGGACVDGQTSNANCGDCGNACVGGSSCTAGRCACPGTQQLCGSGAAATCIDTLSNAMNCGACGNACAAGQTCTAGVCACPAGQSACGSGTTATCVNLNTSATDCGTCGNACPSGQVCSGGSCTCPAGQTLCGGVCVSTATSNANCGACGFACGAAQTCSGGACTCPAGQTACGTACLDTRTDNANCGACGNVCAGGQTCQSSVCTCPAGQSLCAGACVDTRTNNANCGTCGTVCPSAQTCQAGVCNCPAGLTFCGGTCVDTRTNNANCGTCGTVCPGTAPCTAGVCTAGPPPNDNRVGAITLDTSAPTATVIVNNSAANNSTLGNCGCSGGHDVFYTFTLTQQEIVYADTVAAAGIDSSLFLQTSAGANIASAGIPGGATCNDDRGTAGCAFPNTLDAQIVALLPAGTYYLVLSGCGAGGEATVHFQHLPANNVVQRVTVTPGATFSTSNDLVGASGITGACCSTGPEATYYAISCPGAAAVPMTAVGRSGGLTNLTLDQRSAARAPVAACAANAACGANATLNTTLPAGAGLHTFYVDSCTAGGPYTLGVTFGTCAAGTTLCNGTCVNTGTDGNNCGACGTVCTGGRTCTGSTCGCAAGTTFCGGTCIATTADVNNCGACGTRCGPGQTCTAGACATAITGLSFRIDSLSTAACTAVEHTAVTGDDRGGIAVSGTNVFYSGDSATARFPLATLAPGVGVGRVYDGLISNLRTGKVYTLATSPTTPVVYAFIATTYPVTHLIEIDGATGALTTNVIALSATISVPTGNAGIFSGYDRMGIHTGAAFYHISPTGLVTNLGAMPALAHTSCENWAYWGTMEFFGGQLYVDYVSNATTISRATVPSGTVTTLGAFTALSDMCSFTVQPSNNRWYFHHEYTSQFHTESTPGAETIGFCTAAWSSPNDTFRIGTLSGTGCTAVDEVAVAGDDRGGIAVSSTNVFYTGDSATGRFSTADVGGGTVAVAAPAQLDSITQNLRTGTIYSLGTSATTILPGGPGGTGGTVTHLLEINGNTGALTGRTIALSTPISVGSGTGIFAGWDRIVILNGTRAYDIALPTGSVVDLGARPIPVHTGCENWAFWGTAEFFGGQLYVDYVANTNTIARMQVSTGAITTIAAFPNVGTVQGLSDMCSFTFSPQRNRWYWHHEYSSTLRTSLACFVDETVGFCGASYTNP